MSSVYVLSTKENIKNVYSNKKSLFVDMDNIKSFTLHIIKDEKRYKFSRKNVCRELINSDVILILAIHNKSNIRMEYKIKKMCIDNEYFKKK